MKKENRRLMICALSCLCVMRFAVALTVVAAESPYAEWENGPPDDPAHFPIGVWLQSPSNAEKYKASGINMYVGLWQGPTEEQLDALEKAGNENFRIEIVPGSDHNIILCETGSMKERNKRSGKGWSNYAPEYLEMMGAWLRELALSQPPNPTVEARRH